MNRSPRSGFTLIEMAIAAGLLGVLFGVLGQFVSRWEGARRAADERAFALRTLENVLERTLVDDAEPQALSTRTDVTSRLKSAQLQITRGEPDDLGLVAMTGTLSWQNAQGQRVAPIVLTTWRRADIAKEGAR